MSGRPTGRVDARIVVPGLVADIALAPFPEIGDFRIPKLREGP